MKAAVLRSFGSSLQAETLPDPDPGAGEVVVDVAAPPVLSYAKEVFSGERQYPLLVPLVPYGGLLPNVA
jgi:alcohol dehydrogenase